jgi:catalase
MSAAFQYYLKRHFFCALAQISLFFKANPNYGSRVTGGLELDVKKIEILASMTKAECPKATEK